MAKNDKSETLYLKEAAAYLGLSEMFTRQLLSKGKISGEKVATAGSDMKVWSTTKAACDAYLATAAQRGGGGRSGANGKKFLIAVPTDQVDELVALLRARGIEPQNPYQANYDYQKKRREQKRAEKAAGQTANANNGAQPVQHVDNDAEFEAALADETA